MIETKFDRSRRSTLLIHTFAVFAVLLAGCESSHPAAPMAADPGPGSTTTFRDGSRLVLQHSDLRDTLRVALEERWGGALVEVSLNGDNFVNAYDAGREIQLSLYDGAHQYDQCAGCSGAWGWNPVQAGDVHRSGPTILESGARGDTLYVKVQPNHWIPDNKGGGAGRPVASDIIVEQWVNLVAPHRHVVRLAYRIRHVGSDRHTNSHLQEFPAVYINSDFDQYVHYAGSSPWSNDAVTFSPLPHLFLSHHSRLPTTEWWSGFVNGAGYGITLFAPGSFPYTTSGVQAGSKGATGSGAGYTHPFTPFGIEPHAVIEGEIYLLPGDYEQARETIYELGREVRVRDLAWPLIDLDSPLPDAEVTGSVEVSGWAYDNVSIARVEIWVDQQLSGLATLGQFRPELRSEWPAAPSNTGFSYVMDTRSLSSGLHSVIARAYDTAGHAMETGRVFTVVD